MSKWRPRWSRVVGRRAFAYGLLGRCDYTPFVVLSRSRVGSNLLRSVLNDHPRILAFGEVFRNLNELDWDHTGYFRMPSTRAIIRQDPVQSIEWRLFGRYPQTLQAVGLKLSYYHARTDAQAAVWSWLIDRRDIRVIHLKRSNLLQTHVSRKRALLTGQWVNTSGVPDAAVTLRLDFDEMLRDFQQTRAWEGDADRTFASHPLLQVRY